MRKDLLTGEQFSPKRITQKFASAENRIIYYNNKANQEGSVASTEFNRFQLIKSKC